MKEQYIRVDPHFYSAFLASAASIELLEILPENDLVEELKNILAIQFELFCCLLEGKHFGSNNLEDFQEYCQKIKNQADRLKEEK